MKVITYGTRLNESGRNILLKEACGDYACVDQLDRPDKVAEFMVGYLNMDKRAEEYLYLCALNAKNYLLGLFEVSHGTANCAHIGSREIFLRALLCGASQIIIAHNHPSGDPLPSQEDIWSTRQIEKAGKLMCIPLIDHIIIGRDGKYTSLKDSGFLE